MHKHKINERFCENVMTFHREVSNELRKKIGKDGWTPPSLNTTRFKQGYNYSSSLKPQSHCHVLRATYYYVSGPTDCQIFARILRGIRFCQVSIKFPLRLATFHYELPVINSICFKLVLGTSTFYQVSSTLCYVLLRY